jgi:hypothetical protein
VSDRSPKGTLLERLHYERARLDTCLNSLDQERVTESGVVGAWSVRDVLTHIVAHEQRALAEVRLALRGQRLEIDHSATDAFNAEAVTASEALSFAEIRQRWEASYQEVVALVSVLPDAAFDPSGTIATVLDDSIEGALGNNTYDHYAAHRRDIEAWLDATSQSHT